MTKIIELVQPTPEQQVEIRKTFNEDLKTRDAHLQTIKDWLLKQPHLPNEFDDQRLMTFLRGCNFSLEKCKKKLDMYFTMRTAIPEFFTNRDITRPEILALFEIGHAPTLPQLTKEGYRVTVFRCVKENFEIPDIADAFKLEFMVGDARLEMEKYGVAGDIYVVDASVATWNNFLKVNLIVAKKFLICAQQAYPVKIKQVHLVNASPIVHKIITFFKPILKEKIRERIFIHDNLESLHKMVSKDILPAEFGGTNQTTQYYMDLWLETAKYYTQWFKEQEMVKADESKRPGKPTNYDDLFGLEGSFKQLSID